MASGGGYLPRCFAVNNCYLRLRENLVIMWPYTEQPSNRPSAPHWIQCLIPHFLASLGAQEQLDIALIFPHFAHQCCDHLTAVKTGYPLTSIAWPYRGLRYRPIEIDFFWSYPLTSYYWIRNRTFNRKYGHWSTTFDFRAVYEQSNRKQNNHQRNWKC